MTRIVDRLLLVASAGVIAGIAIGYAILGNDNLDPKWIGLVVQTLTLFGYLLTFNRSSWPYIRFWQVIVLLLTIHCVLSVVLLRKVDKFPLILFVLPAVLETLIYQSILERYARRRCR